MILHNYIVAHCTDCVNVHCILQCTLAFEWLTDYGCSNKFLVAKYFLPTSHITWSTLSTRYIQAQFSLTQTWKQLSRSFVSVRDSEKIAGAVKHAEENQRVPDSAWASSASLRSPPTTTLACFVVSCGQDVKPIPRYFNFEPVLHAYIQWSHRLRPHQRPLRLRD